ncbi:Bestrophin/UPF0187 [Chytridium lagenaria]|nr:Bestrophin/UPF0187 [Chytridium lagenaria]
MGLVVSLMLVFRNNTAYDRYWEGRRTWSSVTTHCRNLCRVLHTMADHTDKDARAFIEKRGALHMILAFPVATKYLLRGEQGIKYTDLFHLLAHIPAFSHSKKPRFSPTKVPLEILWHLNAYINRGRKLNVYDAQGQVHSLTALAGLADALTVFERIRGTPVPLIYKIHVKMVLLLYLMSLPFQLVQAIGFFTIPVVAIAAFVFLGIESIALEIENPFGEDPNDLPLDDFINQVRGEIWDMEKYTERFGQWGSWNTEMVDDGKEHVEVDHEGLGGGGGGGGGGGVVDAD